MSWFKSVVLNSFTNLENFTLDLVYKTLFFKLNTS